MKIITRARLLLPALALVVAGACSDLSVGSGGDEVTGLTLDSGGTTLVLVAPNGAVTGSLSVGRNATRSIQIVLRGPGGVVLPDVGESIRVTVTNPGVATWTEASTSSGTLRGVAAGNTTLRVDLISGGTAEYTSPLIPVQVN